MLDGSDRVTAIEGILTDVTERKRSEAWLSFSHILLTTAIESSPDAVLIVDAGNRIIKFNRHFVDLWDIPQELVSAGSDEPVLQAVASRMKDQGEFVARVRYLYDHPEIQSHEELELENGRIVDRHSGSLFDAQRKYLGRIWFFRDITDSKRAVQKIAALARTDSLSGLPNRAAFLERLQLAFARARRSAARFAVLYLDLDHFKDINDTLGHAAGDALLQAVADRLKGAVRETDMVARFGGDEFAVLQENVTDLSNIELLARKIGKSLAAPYLLNENQVHSTVSIGVVPFASDIDTPEAMLMKADLALYRAKDEGRDRYRFHVAELDEQVRERVMIGEDLHLAIERKEFELHYQPQVELTSGRIVGLEALIRWNHPTRGQLPPTTFIPIAETNGSILPIGHWVIEQACRQFGLWRQAGIVVPIVAVNISVAQLKLATDLDRTIREGLAKNHIAPSQLELELTETVLMETTQRHSEALEQLRAIGVRLAIDDFGTGYSSLDYLRSFHVSCLKIDRGFVDGVTTNPDDATIVRATISLAHALGIEVVAEGVETAEQRAFLIAAGCRFAQGHLFGEAMPVGRVTELLRSQ